MSLLAVLERLPVLTHLLRHLSWSDFRAVLSASRSARCLFDDPVSRDIILSRYVPGYQYALRHADPRHVQSHFNVTVHDLHLFLISQKYPLHLYPEHAHRLLSCFLPSLQDDRLTSRLIDLTQAHSLFVLLLQNLIHSSSSIPIAPEPRSSQANFPGKAMHALRELQFPPPLSYSPPRSENTSHAKPRRAPPRPSVLRRTLFGRSTKPTPPPLPEPRALQTYSSSWRRTFSRKSSSQFPPSAFHYDDLQASDSSISDSMSPLSGSRSTSPTPFTSSTTTSSSSSDSSPPSFASTIFPTSPHNFSLATSRTRAPILRVFVPCSDLSKDSEGVLQCEEQLAEHDLWSYLSTGDVICNLGYLYATPSLMPELDFEEPPIFDHDKWLIFDGSHLVPYSPAGDLSIPLRDPLSLPSPFYYAHITSPSVLTNPIFTISRMPMDCQGSVDTQLLQFLTKVPSPHSRSGLALVKKYVWTARIVRIPSSSGAAWSGQELLHSHGCEMLVGEGWYGEWVLESEGTPEGRKILLDWLRGTYLGPPSDWELVRERSGGGKIWLRLLPARDECEHEHLFPHEQISARLPNSH